MFALMMVKLKLWFALLVVKLAMLFDVLAADVRRKAMRVNQWALDSVEKVLQ